MRPRRPASRLPGHANFVPAVLCPSGIGRIPAAVLTAIRATVDIGFRQLGDWYFIQKMCNAHTSWL